MTISATVICDSISHDGHRLTTLVCRYPRLIHQEVLTHRDKSRNSASSRAIPNKTLIRRIREDTAMPSHWGLNQKGMQSSEEASPFKIALAKAAWIVGRECAIALSSFMSWLGFHKQVVNRLLEPFMHMEIVLSGTEWANFFELRCHPDAQPEFQSLACAIRDAMDSSEPKTLKTGEYHLPFIRDEETNGSIDDLKRVSSARCARVSYFLQDGSKSNLEKDLKLCDRLMGGRPFHASPFEHIATPGNDSSKSRNYRGWHQYRAELEEAFLEAKV